MQNIAIITDTESSFPFQLAAWCNTYQVPLTVNFEGESDETLHAFNDADTVRWIDKEN